jgi:serine/threonine-protein kinase
MSPEQASGGAVDKRADIWAFGVVLYEMLAGGRLFEGESAAYVLADVLRSEPDLDRLPPHAPAEIRRLVRRCLNKRVDQRLHDIADARLVIDEVIAGTDNAGIPELVAEAAGHGIAPARALRPAHAGALSLVVALVAAAFGWWFASRSPAEPPPVRVFEIGTDLYSVSAVTLSPDGEKMVLAGRAQEGLESELYLRRMDDTELAPLPGTIGAGQPFFSPDGNWIGYWGTDEDSGPRSLRKVSLEGASLDIQSFDDLFLFDPHWTVDDTIMFARSAPLRSGLIQVIPAEGGTPTEVVESSDDEASVLGGSLSEPRLLPGGGILLQVARGEFEVMRTDIVVYSPATRVADVLVPDANTPRFVAPSYLFYGRGGSVWMAEYDPYGSPVTGPPTLVLQGVSSSRTSTSYDVAGDGTIAYSPGEFREPSSAPTQRRLVTIDRQGVEQPTGIAATGLGAPRHTPHRRRIAVTRFEDGDTHVWVYDAVTGAEQRTPSVRERNTSPRWSPDGEWVYFDASGEDAAEIYRARPDFPGEAPELLGEGGGTGCWTSRPMGASCSPRRAASTSRFCPSTAKRPRCSSRPIATS